MYLFAYLLSRKTREQENNNTLMWSEFHLSDFNSTEERRQKSSRSTCFLWFQMYVCLRERGGGGGKKHIFQGIFRYSNEKQANRLIQNDFREKIGKRIEAIQWVKLMESSSFNIYIHTQLDQGRILRWTHHQSWNIEANEPLTHDHVESCVNRLITLHAEFQLKFE